MRSRVVPDLIWDLGLFLNFNLKYWILKQVQDDTIQSRTFSSYTHLINIDIQSFKISKNILGVYNRRIWTPKNYGIIVW